LARKLAVARRHESTDSRLERLEVAKPIIIGHSISGIIATIYAGTYPTAGLVTSGRLPARGVQRFWSDSLNAFDFTSETRRKQTAQKYRSTPWPSVRPMDSGFR